MSRHLPFMKPKFSSSGLRPLAGMLALLAGLCATSARAEDIDIYAAGSTEATLPNILFFMDNTSNWSASNQAWGANAMWTSPLKCQSLSGSAKTNCINTYQADPTTKDLIESIFYYGIGPSQKRPWESGFAANRDDVSLKQGQVEMRTLRLVS